MTVTETSKEAFQNIDPRQAEYVLKDLAAFGADGATCEQVCMLMTDNTDYPTLHYGTVSARMTGLKDSRDIFAKNERRKTKSGNEADVFVHKKFATEEEMTVIEKGPSRKQELARISQAQIGFLNGLKTANVLSGIWLRGLDVQIEEMKKAMELLK